jgi:hypothetical protein
MRHPSYNRSPTLSSELGALAGLYRTVFWMMGRKARYGRLWPPEAQMDPAEHLAAPNPPPSVMEHTRPHLVEAGSRE